MRIIFFISLLTLSVTLQAQQSPSFDDSLQTLLAATRQDTTRVSLLNKLAENQYDVNLKKSLAYAEQAILIGERIHDARGTKNGYNLLRRIYRRMGNFEAAIRYTLITLPLAERLRDTTEMLNCYTALGNTYSSLENYDEAKTYLSKAYTLAKRHHASALPSVMNFIGRNFGKQKKYDSALYFITRALLLERESPQPGYSMSYIYNNLGEVYLGLKKYKDAENYLTRSLELPDDQKNSFGMTFTLNTLAMTYQATDRFDLAVSTALRSIDIAKKNTYRDKVKETYFILYNIYEQQHDYKMALEYYRQFNLYQDSIFSDEKLKAIENLKINYETEKIARENELLRKDTELKDAKITEQFSLYTMAVLGITALLILILLLYRNNQQRIKTNNLLNQYNRDLAEQVYKRTLDLADSNTELVRQNSQLEQFGYIIAHNLRAPVARILGLTSIINSSEFSLPADQKVIDKLQFTAHELDTVIHDLNSILDIKKGINNTLEQIDLSQRIEKVKNALRDKIRESNTVIYSDFSAINSCYAIPAYIDSILYNLLSNAIKYKSNDRSPVIDILSRIEGTMICILVEDNGMGIDLDTQREKLFNLYQRFHYHVEGKGMGLFLVKTQVEAMNGTIEVTSQIEIGTTFKICLPASPLT